MNNSNVLLQADEPSIVSWTATAERWNDESGEFALPIPLDIQQKLGLNENSILTATFVDGRIVISEVRTKISLHDNDT